ncbi:undecaprenyldiphospho-muramoylpentapeptide beta-N-acetylglucosaminyltransferase [Lentzea tibetensis]|uniref:UDP-N-acetylglucosamine--N-acetylmuramyl-(pentapeptide) pyrophosphoryl-undecaprenol N-acetylglucosamine transferase n=1 Tax=Lentzea tibetensis TaxID=2591470 RepID=A0A563EWA0_9PSEU|nr:undecaprenyldiphospho-muramoylpentapeptide beta-N-acetylglucosaminyltransferase [Lentzea tibetensis]TWP51949.1 undecaprenyldiphospho-muramoylpentapeptide beta-N-acetylglucosaminyltransferase [Lentzea tibetensis]
MSLSVVIAAGGTGGHIYPGLALAEAIKESAPDARITFVGTTRGLEGKLVPSAGFPLRTVDMVPLTVRHGLRFPVALGVASAQCGKVLREERAQVAVGMGGYSSAPLLVAARLAGVPSVIHDSNAVPGRANRFSARLTDNVALAFPEAADHLPSSVDCRTVGMPLAATLSGFDRAALRPAARASLGLAEDTVLVLVNGGSLGATRLNLAAAELAGRWRSRADVRIVIKAGREGADELNRRISSAGASDVAHAVTYIDRMDTMYAAADLTVCRAGAATVAELGQVGLPSVLVPYPHAPHDHQTRNAQALVNAGAAVLLTDAETSAARLESVVGELIADRSRRAAMSAAALRTSRPDAARSLAEWVCSLASTGKES